MSEKRVVRQYEIEFKLDAVRLVEEQGYSVPEAAQRLGILKSNLSNWRRQYREGRLMPGYLRAQPTPAEAEVRQLRAKIKRLEMENEILKNRSWWQATTQRDENGEHSLMLELVNGLGAVSSIKNRSLAVCRNPGMLP